MARSESLVFGVLVTNGEDRSLDLLRSGRRKLPFESMAN